jgi:HdeA/HdeB family
MGTKILGALVLAGCLLPFVGRAAEVNLATVSCDKYENEILPATGSDAINTVMWLMGFSVGRSGEHVMYGDALTSFGFALDAECKNNPSTSLLQALSAVRPKRDKPMDLTALSCANWEKRHEESNRTDPESAATLMMWLFGYSVGQAGSHIFDAGGVKNFSTALQTRCAQHPEESLFESLVAMSGPTKH